MVTFTASPATFATDKMEATGLATDETLTFLIYDDSAALTTWTAAATDAAKTAVGSYSDGYAIQMKASFAATAQDTDTHMVGVCIGGKKDTVEFATCSVSTSTAGATASDPATYPFTYSTAALAQQASGDNYDVSSDRFTAATVSTDDYLGWNKTWKCTRTKPSTIDIVCNRFQITEANSAAALRLDSTTTSGALSQVKGAGALVASTPATWKSAATLTLSAAAAVVAAAAF